MKTLISSVRELCRDWRFSVGAAVLLVLGVSSLLTLFSPYDPTKWYLVTRDLPPSWEHLLGTSSLGRDVFWQLTHAVRNSLQLAIMASAISRVIALTIGMTAGYRGGVTDRMLMFLSDGFMVIPLFLILVLLAMLIREHMNLVNMAVLFGIVGWPWDTRLIRSQILSLREREFTYTAILSGTPTRKLLVNEYIPFIIPLVLATFIGHMGFVVGMEITLAFIGLTDLSIPTIGAILQWAIAYQAILLGYWWWLFTPIAVTLAVLIALYLLAVSISEYLDPRARMQRVGAR